MTINRFSVFKLAGVTVTLMGAFALIVVLAPVVRGQDRPRPLSDLWVSQGPGIELGVTLRDVDEDDVKTKKLQAQAGAIVERVHGAGAAAKAGFRAGDVVLTFDGESVRSARHLGRLISETPEGREVTATVLRDGARVELKVAPQSAPSPLYRFSAEPREVRRFTVPEVPRFEFDSFDFLDRVTPRGEAGRWVFGGNRGRLGAGVQELTDQLSEYFGTTGGALVTSVEDDSIAKAAGLRAGDVITKINDQAVRTTADLRRAINATAGEVTLTVMRDRKEVTLKAKFDGDAVDGPRRRSIR